MRLSFFYSALFFSLLSIPVWSQVIINEFSAANMDGITDNFSEREDWIELYNLGNQPVNLEGYSLTDNINKPTKWKFPAGITIIPGEHKLIFASGRNLATGGYIHANFKITQTKNEYVALYDASQNLLDVQQTSTRNQANHSIGRVTDGSPVWGIFSTPTPGAPNANAYEAYAALPSASMEAGFYNGSISVSLSSTGGNAIHYTLDGSEPGSNSPIYTGSISISETTVLKAKSYSEAPTVLPSFTLVNTYFINASHTVPVLSVSGSSLSNLFNGSQFYPRGSFEYFKNGERIDFAYGEFNKHGNDSWFYQQRGVDYITRDQMGYSNAIKHRFFSNKTRNSFQRLILKAAANDNYPALLGGAHIRDAYVQTLSQRAHLELDERSWAPAVLYLNGKYWGLYDIREKVDDSDYTSYYYNQDKEWLDYIKTWGGTWAEYGSRWEWDLLRDFIYSEDMSKPANYEYIKSQLNVLSLIDYMLINTHVVCKDWLNWNTGWWRGRNPEGDARTWRYTLWDMDAVFGHYTNYTSIPDVSPNADPCYAENLPLDFEGHGALIEALMANEEFHSLYVNRYADLNNTYFSCDYMISLLDSMIAVITPEMPAQIQRWGGTMGSWLSNVNSMRNFILARCDTINGGIEGCYDVVGPYPVTVKIVPEDSPNRVKVNTIIPETYPFTGDYFVGTKLDFLAVPDPEWTLDHWAIQHNTFQPNQFAEAIQLALTDTSSEVVTAYFRPLVPCAAVSSVQSDSTLSSLSLSWFGPSNFLSYEFGYRKSGTADDWTTLSLTDPEYTVYGLELCTKYDFRIRTICEFSLGNYFTFSKKTACLSGTEEQTAGVFEWSAFPNPFSDQLSVDLILSKTTDVQLQFLSLSGQVLYSETLPRLSAGQHRRQLEVNPDWSGGLYLVRLITEDGSLVKRVVKMR